MTSLTSSQTDFSPLYFTTLPQFFEICGYSFMHSSFKVPTHDFWTCQTEPLQHLDSFSLFSQSDVDLIKTDRLTFDFQMTWYTEEFMFDSK